MSRPSDKPIQDAIAQQRGESMLPLIQYRQTLALEEIAETLKTIEGYLTSPPVLVATKPDGEAVLHPVGPATDVENAGTPRARRRRSEET